MPLLCLFSKYFTIYFQYKYLPIHILQVGYLSASIRSVADARVGDTITHYSRKAEQSLPGYKEATPMVFCGLFPVDADQYYPVSLFMCLIYGDAILDKLQWLFSYCRFHELRDALDKLQLNDAALKVGPF